MAKVNAFIQQTQTLLLLATAFLLVACTDTVDKAQSTAKLSGETMGTFWQVTLAHELDDNAGQALQTRIEAALEAINAGMSTYREDSELMRFNRSSETTVQAISPELRRVVAKALEISAQSDGAYDVTVGPLVNVWGFGPKRRADKPAEAEIAAALALVGYDKLQLDDAGLAKSEAGVFVDLSSIAKGYGVDAVGEAIAAAGYQHFLVEIGGEVRAWGDKYGKPWRVGIERPQSGARGAVQNVIAMEAALPAMATSGNYRNYIEHQGEVAYHIIDPKSGHSRASSLLSATVLAADCMTADGYATALMVLGDDKAMAFADAHGLAAELIFAGEGKGEFVVKRSRAFVDNVKESQ
ncbi:MAG: FAD:protein FMN transferase [Cardiobacteriaceae bacterium]|nr:FAD:protein FMN transferase [Cardiobacteriaceae bacterium]